MGRTTLWGTQPHLSRLYWLSRQELYKIYPDYAKGTISGKQYYWKTKVKKGELPMPPKPEQEPTPVDGQLKGFGEVLKLHNMTPEMAQEFTEQGFHVGYIKNSEGEIEYTVPLPNAKNKPGLDPELLTPATPAKITPSRRKAPKRDHNVLFVFSDTQIDFRRIIDGRTSEQELVPTHDVAAIRAAQLVAADLQPNLIINTGDTADYSNLSRWPANSDHFFKTMGLTHQAVHDMYAQFRSDNPRARIIEVDSNHNERFKKFVLKNFPQMYDLYRPGDDSEHPVASYGYLANLELVDVEWYSGGQEAEFLYGEDYTEEINGRTYPKPPLRFAHGTETGQNGLAVQKINKNHPETSNVQGHAHSEQYIARVNRLGQRIINIVIPPLCKTTGELESYHSQINDKNRVNGVQEAWPQGVTIIRDYEGEYVPEFIPIKNGIATSRERTYDGNE